MGFEANEEKLNDGTYPESENLTLARNLLTKALYLMGQSSLIMTNEVKIFVQKNGFPSFIDWDAIVVNTCWLIIQHVDEDVKFQVEMLQKMFENKKKKTPGEQKEPFTLVYFYYLTDRICKKRFGYQIFGTQNKADRTIKLPEDLISTYSRDIPSMCLGLVKNKLSEVDYVINQDQQNYFWSKAKDDAKATFEDNPPYQDSIIEKFIQKSLI